MPNVPDLLLTRIVPRLAEVPGIVGIALGGSRARGTANAASDYDIGLYYGPDEPLDTVRLLNAAAVTPVGGWGPRIVGGGWLRIGGRKVDLLYRGVEPVRAAISARRALEFSPVKQAGNRGTVRRTRKKFAFEFVVRTRASPDRPNFRRVSKQFFSMRSAARENAQHGDARALAQSNEVRFRK
jgi:hypothetical protein